MQHLEVSGAVRHIYIYVISRLRVNYYIGYKLEENETAGNMERTEKKRE